QLEISNPYKAGRTLLHFEGAGQKTDVYVFTTKVGSHVGGYDEFTIDITDAVEAFKKTDVFKKQFKGKIPVSIRTDNSRDLEMIPSSLSDFTVYGGLYRYVNLVYVPAVSVDKIFATPELDKTGKTGKLQIKARFYNTSGKGNASASVKLFDPSGKLLQEVRKELASLQGDLSLAQMTVKNPVAWSTDDPRLYTVEVKVMQDGDSSTSKEKIGFRNFEFMTKGPFNLNGKRLLLNGTHRHEDHAGVGAAMTEDMIRTEMILMKEICR
ncbi:MAG: glycoside hydrolase family 2, partial [Chitinophagaceae bacterium]